MQRKKNGILETCRKSRNNSYNDSRILNNSNFPSVKTLDVICRASEITEKELFAGFSTYKLSAQEFILLKYFRQLPDSKKIALLQFLAE